MHILVFHKGVHNFEIEHKRANFWLGVKFSLVIIREIAFLPHLALTSTVLVVVLCEVNSSPPPTRWMQVADIHLDLWHSERRGPVEDLTEYLQDTKLRKAINWTTRDPESSTDCVYEILSTNCNHSYIGETGRRFSTLLNEHKKETKKLEASKKKYIRQSRKQSENEQSKSPVADYSTL